MGTTPVNSAEKYTIANGKGINQGGWGKKKVSIYLHDYLDVRILVHSTLGYM